jgi:hypothetical protein
MQASMVDSPVSIIEKKASEHIEGDAELNPMFAGSPIKNSHSQSSSSSLYGESAIRKNPIFLALNGGSGIRKRKEIIEFSAVSDQGFHDADEEKSQMEAEILEIDGGPVGPGGSPFKLRRNAAYIERDRAKDRLEFLSKDYDNLVQKATAEFERVMQDAKSAIEGATFRVRKANLCVEEVAAKFLRRKMIQEQLDLLKQLEFLKNKK